MPESELKPHHVTWEIEVDAESYEDAARKVKKIQLDPNSTANVFRITRGRGDMVYVDLDEEKNNGS